MGTPAADLDIEAHRSAAPIVALRADRASGTVPLAVTFSTDGTGTDGEPDRWRLDFGDGTQGLSGIGTVPQNATHLYRMAGRFSAFLWVRDTAGRTARQTVQIEVTERPDDDSHLLPIAPMGGRSKDEKPVMVAAALLTAFDGFWGNQQVTHRARVADLIAVDGPNLPEPARLRVIVNEDQAEKAYVAKARVRIERDLTEALRIVDPFERDQRVRRVLERERRILQAREDAITDRARGNIAAEELRLVSPGGALWILDPVLDNCRFCRQMAGRAWSWDVLALIRPPVHGNCNCGLKALPGDAEILTLGHVPDLKLLGR